MKRFAWLCVLATALVGTGCPEDDPTPALVADVGDVDGGGDADAVADPGPADAVPDAVVDATPDGIVVSGAIRARWTLVPLSCAEVGVVTVRARAVGAGGVTVGEVALACDGSSGEQVIPSLLDGSYLVVIEALDGDGTALYGASESVLVAGGVVATSQMQLLPLDGVELRVRWVFSDGLACVDNGATHVEVRVLDALDADLVTPETVPCGNFFLDPSDGQQKSGVLFGDVAVESAIGANVVVSALDSVGGNVVGSGTGVASLMPGERADVVVTIQSP